MLSIPDLSIKFVLSAPRLSTYEGATTATPTLAGAVALYTWNAQVSAALMFPLHICEVAIRNAVSDALTQLYGPDWPWSSSFVLSLTDPRHPAYNPRQDLLRVRASQPSTGKVIAELKFKFWQTMFTGRFDARLWNLQLHQVMPFVPLVMDVHQARRRIHDDLETLRLLRNRIAHHEPIFTRDLATDIRKMRELVAFRSLDAAAWMRATEIASGLIASKPP